MNDDDLKKLEQNAFRDSMKDGITELLGGILFLCAAILFIEPAFLTIYVVFYLLLMPKAIERLRQKYTYPRLGYVKMKTEEYEVELLPLAVLMLATILGTAAGTQLLTGDIFNAYNWLILAPVAFGILMFGPSIYLVEKTGSPTYWLFGVLTLTVGIIVSYLSILNPPTFYLDGMLIYSMILGVAMLVGGLLKFAYFISRYPVLETQEDDVSEQ